MALKKYVVLFFTQYGATGYARLLKNEGIAHETKPTPRSLSSSCGIAVEMTLASDKNVLGLLTEDVEFIHEIVQDGYELIYENLE